MILFWLLNMTIWCKHVRRLELQKFFNFCAAHSPVRLDIETKNKNFCSSSQDLQILGSKLYKCRYCNTAFCFAHYWFNSLIDSSHSFIHSFIHWGECTTVLPCKAKRQYLLTLQVRRYCLLPLQRRGHLLTMLLLTSGRILIFRDELSAKPL